MDELGSPIPTKELRAGGESAWPVGDKLAAAVAAAAAASASAFLRARIALRVVGGFRAGLAGLLR
jgi:hypothetical protein